MKQPCQTVLGVFPYIIYQIVRLVSGAILAYRPAAMTGVISIYSDEGAGAFSLAALTSFFAGQNLRFAKAEAVLDGSAFEGANLFVMPGGADLPYCRKLNGQGTANIRNFAESGGTYLGICAGAYFACSEVKFLENLPGEIGGPRELGFVQGTAYGSLHDLTPPYDDTLASAAVVKLRLPDGRELKSYYHGGPAFRLAEDEKVNVLARYADISENPPAVISCAVGAGKAILSGVHLEVGADQMKDYPAANEDEMKRARALGNEIPVSADGQGFLRGEVE